MPPLPRPSPSTEPLPPTAPLAQVGPGAAPEGPSPPQGPPAALPSWAFAAGRDAIGDLALFDLKGVVQRMRWCRPGRFVMGAPEAEPGRRGHEGPAHPVALSRGFWLADTPVTVALFYAVTGRLPDAPDVLADDADPLEDADPKAEAPPAPSVPALDGRAADPDAADPNPTDPNPTDCEPGAPEADGEVLEFEYADDDVEFDPEVAAAAACDARPAEGLSWHAAVAFAAQLQRALRDRAAEEGLPCDGLVFRLPTEAEWEYACRAGTAAPTDPGGPEPRLRGERAWLATYPDNTTPPVALRSPNAWGFYDTVGLVWEWCADAVSPLEPYPGGPRLDPFLSGGPCRALRGGAWPRPLSEHRGAGRRAEPPEARPPFAGLRLACGPPLSTE